MPPTAADRRRSEHCVPPNNNPNHLGLDVRAALRPPLDTTHHPTFFLSCSGVPRHTLPLADNRERPRLWCRHREETQEEGAGGAWCRAADGGPLGRRAEVIRVIVRRYASALTDDGRPPLEASGLKLHARLSLIASSLDRAGEKGGCQRVATTESSGSPGLGGGR